MENASQESFSALIRRLRKQRAQPLRVVAAAIKIDSTLLSKLERGERFPTDTQIVRLAKYFAVSKDELKARVLADKVQAQSTNPEIILRAAKILRERSAAYDKDKK